MYLVYFFFYLETKYMFFLLFSFDYKYNIITKLKQKAKQLWSIRLIKKNNVFIPLTYILNCFIIIFLPQILWRTHVIQYYNSYLLCSEFSYTQKVESVKIINLQVKIIRKTFSYFCIHIAFDFLQYSVLNSVLA